MSSVGRHRANSSPRQPFLEKGSWKSNPPVCSSISGIGTSTTDTRTRSSSATRTSPPSSLQQPTLLFQLAKTVLTVNNREMHRQRKKDLNPKPNRRLDQRSSRGMIYENEELRLRTMAIADDVDRGHTDIKKLRKENDHLKREIWSLRDECEKLEDVLKRVVSTSTAGGVIDPSDLPFGDLFLFDRKDSFGGSSASGSYYEEDEEMGGNYVGNMFMMDEEELTETGSVIERDPNGSASPRYSSPSRVSSDFQSCPEISEVPSNFGGSTSHSSSHATSSWGHQCSSTGAGHPSTNLEVVREETESLLASALTTANPSPTDELPDPGQDFVEYPDESFSATVHEDEDCYEFSANDVNFLTCDTPFIHITPASSSSLNHNTCETPPISNSGGGTIPTEYFQEGGCITVLPKLFNVTSQIQVTDLDPQEPEPEPEPLPNFTSISASALPPQSPSSLKKLCQFKKHSATATARNRNDNDRIFRPHSVSGDQPSTSTSQGQGQKSKRYLQSRKTNLAQSSTSRISSPFPSNFSCCPYQNHTHTCPHFQCQPQYQSEPSLSQSFQTPDEEDDPDRRSNLSFHPYQCLHQCPNNHPPLSCTNKSWNSIDQNLAIGYFIPETSSSQEPIRAQEIIDELESTFDPTLEKVKGIRLFPGRVFISLRDFTSVTSLLTQFGPASLVQDGPPLPQFTVRGHRIVFAEGSQQYSTLTLIGLPPEVGDQTVIAVLNQFGQVVAPLERRNYKGVDISERIVRLHLVKPFSPSRQLVNIGGYEVVLSLVPNNSDVAVDDDGCQDLISANIIRNAEALGSWGWDSYGGEVLQMAPIPLSLSVLGSSVPVNQPVEKVRPHVVTAATSTVLNSSNANSTQSSPNVSKKYPAAHTSVPSHNQPVTSHSTNTTTLSTTSVDVHANLLTNTNDSNLKPHKPVGRSTSSNPRLESAPNPLSPIMSKRQLSVCTANIPPGDHPSSKIPLGSQNPLQQHISPASSTASTASAFPSTAKVNSLKVTGGTNSAPNLLPVNPKKPLSRLQRSSPGSLIPMLPGGKQASATEGHIDSQIPQVATGLPSAPTTPTGGGLRPVFPTKGLDPRRGSVVSQFGGENNNNVEKLIGGYPRRTSAGFQGRFLHQGHPTLGQMNSNASSQPRRNSSTRRFGGGRASLPKGEPLPWCGCWGNGCI